MWPLIDRVDGIRSIFVRLPWLLVATAIDFLLLHLNILLSDTILINILRTPRPFQMELALLMAIVLIVLIVREKITLS